MAMTMPISDAPMKAVAVSASVQRAAAIRYITSMRPNSRIIA